MWNIESDLKSLIGKMIGLLLVFTLFMGLSAFAQNLTYDDFDVDDNSVIDKQEFSKVFRAFYWDDWNNVDDPGLDDEDFYTVTYTFIDANHDERLALEEWKNGYTYYYGSYLKNDYTIYDLNHDGYITYNEYVAAVNSTDYYVVIDVDHDAYLSEAELANYVFESWDADDNKMMNRDEFLKLDAYYTDI